MRRAALYVKGRIVVGVNHGDAFGKLTEQEQNEEILSGFFNSETQEFLGEVETDHFFDKDILLIRHALVDDTNDPDTDISSEGERQAESLASLLRTSNAEDHTFIVSPFLRCLRTADVLQRNLRTKVLVEPLIAETPSFLEDDEEFCLSNRCEKFPNFDWQTEDDFILRSESPQTFLQRTLFVLQGLPHSCTLITHFGVICNITKLALCEAKARFILNQGVPPASVTYIHQQEVRKLET